MTIRSIYSILRASVTVTLVLAVFGSFAFGAANPGKASETENEKSSFKLPLTVEVIRDIEYGKGGRSSLKLDLFRPKSPPKGPTPGMVWIHGGGWANGDKASSRHAEMSARIAEQGYVVANINYRLSGEAVFPAAIEDAKCAVRWLRANAVRYGVNPDRIAVGGGSAGGHLALLVGTADETAKLEGTGGSPGVSSRVQAVVGFCAPSNFTIVEQTIQEGRAPSARSFLGGTRDEKPESYRLASPITHISKDDPPFLLIQGKQDKTVPFIQAETMFSRLRDAGVKVRLHPVPEAGHEVLGHALSHADTLKLVFQFLDEHLKK